MAHMIPEAVPDGKSVGEQKLFARLQSLPEDCIAYYEPAIKGRQPDFVVIIPNSGLLVIEAKGWLPRQVLGGDLDQIWVQKNAQEPQTRELNPIRQARDYMHRLMNECRQHPAARDLLVREGRHEGKFIFPLGYFTVLTQMTDEDLRTHRAGDLRTIFPVDRVVTADEFDEWPAFTEEQLESRLASFFNPTWSFPPMTARQVSALRTVLHPEVLIPPTPAQLTQIKDLSQRALFAADQIELKALDAKQEQVARSLGAGHRLLFGVAGSGKTVILIARAKYLSEAYPTGRILVLCYNVTFKSYLAALLQSSSNVAVCTFHGWGVRNGVQWQDREQPGQYGARLLANLESGQGDAGRYDAVLIDEAQDFDPTWFQCARAAMKEPHGGDLLIAGDRNQTNYERAHVSWAKLGINAPGRSKILRQNYRNTRAILAVAAPFADESEDADGIAATACDPAKAERETPLLPALYERHTRMEEIDCAESLVRDLLAGRFSDHAVDPLKPSEIGLLYRSYDDALIILIDRLASVAPTVWLTQRVGTTAQDPRQRVLDSGIKVQTIHSAKGLQYKAVILLFADQLGRTGPDLEKDRHLLYVALTRPEEVLAVTSACRGRPSSSPLFDLLRQSPALAKR